MIKIINPPNTAIGTQYVLSAQTTNATPTEMLIPGTLNGRLTLQNDTTWLFTISLVARRTDADGESAGYKWEGVIDRNNSAATTRIVESFGIWATEDTPAWDASVSADTVNGALKIQVTGQVGKTIIWYAYVRTVEVTG